MCQWGNLVANCVLFHCENCPHFGLLENGNLSLVLTFFSHSFHLQGFLLQGFLLLSKGEVRISVLQKNSMLGEENIF